MGIYKTMPAFLMFLISMSHAWADDKPIVYNYVAGQRTEMDEAVSAQLSPRFRLVDIYGSREYEPPQPIAGSLPRSARTESGEVLSGYVLVGYVVTSNGTVAEPFVITTTDSRLSATAFSTMKEWRFAPAKLKGTPIAATAAQEFVFEGPPTQYVAQVLEPTGGRILRPKDWFYAERHSGPSYTWIISREEATRAPYTTGVRIQILVDVKKNTGKDGREFVMDFVAGKKRGVVAIVKDCPEMSQGLFTRICLETEEGPYHILYSLFWGPRNTDIVVISIAGTTKELWDVYSPAFDRMAVFEPIDMKRFEK